MQKKLIITGAIIAVIILIVVAFIINYDKKDQKQEGMVVDKIVNVEKEKIKKVKEIAKEDISDKKEIKDELEKEMSDKFADWKTYKNEKYGFEFKYPKSISISLDKEEIFGDDVKISLMNDTEFPILDVFVWTKESYNELMNDPDSYSSSKLKAGMSTTIKKDNKVYELSFGFQDAPKEIAEFVNSEDYKKLLDTFKFSE